MGLKLQGAQGVGDALQGVLDGVGEVVHGVDAPLLEDVEFVDAIQEDIHWLGFDWGDRLFYGSDYFEKTYELNWWMKCLLSASSVRGALVSSAMSSLSFVVIMKNRPKWTVLLYRVAAKKARGD